MYIIPSAILLPLQVRLWTNCVNFPVKSQLFPFHDRKFTKTKLVHETATYNCDDTRGCVMQF